MTVKEISDLPSKKHRNIFRYVKFREYNLMPNMSVWTIMFYSTLPVSLKRKNWITFFFFEKDIIALDLIAYIRWELQFNNISNSCRVLHCITHMLYGKQYIKVISGINEITSLIFYFSIFKKWNIFLLGRYFTLVKDLVKCLIILLSLSNRK